MTMATRAFGVTIAMLVAAGGCTDRLSTAPQSPQPTVATLPARPVIVPSPSALPPVPTFPSAPRDEMVDVPAGTFVMGCDAAVPSCATDAQPRHEVTLDAYAIDKYEVTVGDYALCRAAGTCWEPGCPVGEDPNKPMRCVGVAAALAFCRWVEKRLPTEAEWERAARGLDDRPFPWGHEAPEGRACWKGDGPCLGGSFPRGVSPVGAHDMAGNVSEWVGDYYHPDYYRQARKKNPTGYDGPPLTLVVCSDPACAITRGGSWNDPVEALATSTRNKRAWPQFVPDAGFRCARSIAP